MPSDAPGEPTHRVVLQRVRNRIIEYLELASSFEEQRTYQSRVPVSVPNEVINIWEDWFSGDNELVGPVFTREERDALDAFHRTWQNVAHSAPDPLPALTEVQSLPAWGELRASAADALLVLGRRGKLSEDHEI